MPIPIDPRDPQTPEEWQAAADAAEGCLAMHDAVRFGLMSDAPAVDVARCTAILDIAREEHDITPRADAIERFIAALKSGGIL